MCSSKISPAWEDVTEEKEQSLNAATHAYRRFLLSRPSKQPSSKLARPLLEVAPDSRIVL
jgi:hypothetical protein